MFKNQPTGLYILSLANTGERFGYYTMLAVLVLFLKSKFGLDEAVVGQIYGLFLGVSYFLPMFGGALADRWSYNKCVILGMTIMAVGYLVIALPSGFRSDEAITMLIVGLGLIAVGTGLFKGNIQVLIGDLYNEPRYKQQRDNGFNIFYMIFNLGALFAPMMATWLSEYSLAANGFIYNGAIPGICNAVLAGNALSAEQLAIVQQYAGSANLTEWCTAYMDALSTGYGYTFAVAFASVILSYLIYAIGHRTFKHVCIDRGGSKKSAAAATAYPELTPEQTRSRMVALFLVFGVVIFFWMIYMQNGATLTLFAENCTASECGGATRIGFNVWALLVIAVGVFALFGIFQNKTAKSRIIAGIILAACVGVIAWIYSQTPNPVTAIQPQIYQQFDPFYVVAFTPVFLAIFTWLGKRGKEPSAPRKIGYGMVMLGVAFVVMIFASLGCTVNANGQVSGSASPNWLMLTYLIMVISELLLQPIGASFVTQVAPPKYKGAMMGCWFLAAAVGNYLTSIPMLLWGKVSMPVLWAILVGLCLLAAGFIFSIMKRLEAVTSESTAPAEEATSIEAEMA